MATPDLFQALGMMYVTHVLNVGDRNKSESIMQTAMQTPAFMAAARAQLAKLEGPKGDEICDRDFVSQVYRKFLREQIAAFTASSSAAVSAASASPITPAN